MSTINSHFNPAIQLNLMATHKGNALSERCPCEEARVEMNGCLQLENNGDGTPLDKIWSLLKGQATSAADFSGNKLHAAAANIMAAYGNVQKASACNIKSLDDVNEVLGSLKAQVQVTQGALDDIQDVINVQSTKANYSQQQMKAAIMKEAHKQQASAEYNTVTTHTSYAELWAAMASAIDNIKSGYVDFYADLMQKYTKMYEAYNKHVQGAVSNAVDASSDPNKVRYDTGFMRNGYVAFDKERKSIEADLPKIQNWAAMSQEEQKSMSITLEPAFKVSKDGSISFNIGGYEKGIPPIFNNAPAYPKGIGVFSIQQEHVSTASYQAWLASFNGGSSALQSNMQAFAQRYSQANSTFDNLNKVLSGSISSLADSAKEFLRNLS